MLIADEVIINYGKRRACWIVIQFFAIIFTLALPQTIFADARAAHTQDIAKVDLSKAQEQTLFHQLTTLRRNLQNNLPKLQKDFRERLELLDPIRPTIKELSSLAPLLPELIGMQGEKHYLILLQNNHELRATGGFITSVGRLTLKDGKIHQLFFADSHKIYNENSEYPWAPPPMQHYMGVDLMFLRDANWSPDLPTSAQLIRSLYLQDRNIMLDGIITLDLEAIARLIDALGPLYLDGMDEPITGKNILEQIKTLWHRPPLTEDTAEEAGFGVWWHQRKSFIPTLVKVAQAELAAGNVNYLKVAMAGLMGLNSKSIQIWLNNEQAATQLATFQWDGGLHTSPENDFLMVVDSNLGYNKVDALLQREVAYKVAWPNGPELPAIADVTLHYTHPVISDGHICDLTPRYGETYDEMTQRCYFNYVRLFVPAGSQLLEVDGVEEDSISSRRGEKSTQVLAGYFQLEPGRTQRIHFRYQLPTHIRLDNYQLQFQRQSGTAPLPLAIEIDQKIFTMTLHTGYLTWQGEGLIR